VVRQLREEPVQVHRGLLLPAVQTGHAGPALSGRQDGVDPGPGEAHSGQGSGDHLFDPRWHQRGNGPECEFFILWGYEWIRQ
jgi:hypothetical protein